MFFLEEQIAAFLYANFLNLYDRLKNKLTVFLEITTVHLNFVSIKKQTILNVSVLARKILPPIFGIATVGWIIGGTIWFDNQSRLVSANSLSNTSTVNRSAVFLQTTTPPRAACCDSIHFQALNLFFKKDKFRFAENEELHTYFKDLNAYLQQNPMVRLNVAALHAHTEGAKIAKNRLAFMTDFLISKKMNIAQFVFEDKKALPSEIATDGDAKNQRVEIRLIMP